MLALEILKRIYINNHDTRFQRNNIDINFTIHDFFNVNEAIAELEERQKEDEYIHQKMKESLSMGSKAQSLAFVEVYQIINNRVSN